MVRIVCRVKIGFRPLLAQSTGEGAGLESTVVRSITSQILDCICDCCLLLRYIVEAEYFEKEDLNFVLIMHAQIGNGRKYVLSPWVYGR